MCRRSMERGMIQTFRNDPITWRSSPEGGDAASARAHFVNRANRDIACPVFAREIAHHFLQRRERRAKAPLKTDLSRSAEVACRSSQGRVCVTACHPVVAAGHLVEQRKLLSVAACSKIGVRRCLIDIYVASHCAYCESQTRRTVAPITLLIRRLSHTDCALMPVLLIGYTNSSRTRVVTTADRSFKLHPVLPQGGGANRRTNLCGRVCGKG